MQRPGDVPRADEQRAVGRWGRGLGLGLGLGAVAGVLVGLAIGFVAFDSSAAIFTAALAAGIFGTVVGAFMGGMSTLEDPAPGAEARTHDPSLGTPGPVHDETDPPE
jgi:hypothetical protein